MYMSGLEITIIVLVNDSQNTQRHSALSMPSQSITSAHADILFACFSGFKRLMIDVDTAKPDKQLKMDTLFKSDKAAAAPAKAGSSKRKSAAPTKRVPKTPQQAQREQQAEHAEHAQQAAAAAAAGRTSKRSMSAAAAAAGDTSSGGGVMDEEEEGSSARAGRVQSRAEHLHLTQLGSPSASRGSKHRNQSVSHEVR